MELQIEITGNTAVVAEIVIPGLYQRVHLALKVGRTWRPQHDPRAGKLPGNISRALAAEEARGAV